jgi:primosomal protein N' (replication factor Y)
LQVAHLDREFDYLVPSELDEAAQPGVRVKIRFSGRLVDGILLERRESSDHSGKLGWLDKVISPERVLTPEVSALVSAVAARYAGTRADVLRLALPPRHARVEAEQPDIPEALAVPKDGVQPDLEAWSAYAFGAEFVASLAQGRVPRAVWQALPGEDWPVRLAELASVVAAHGRGALLIVPDQRDLDRVAAACAERLGAGRVAALAAGLGPAQRYRRWLAVLRGQAPVVVGTRSAVFAPVQHLALTVVWDDGDDSLAEPRAPYPHARDVAMLRAHLTQSAAVLAGISRTAEAQAIVETGWAHDLVAPRAVVRERAPHVQALADSDEALARDPAARAARLPAIAFAAARRALDADSAVLVQVPRRGYLPALACARCRTPARCRRCAGPLAQRAAGGLYECRWCGVADASPRCVRCGSDQLRAVIVGARRTAEELGRAFPGVPVRTSGGADVLTAVEPGRALVVSTPGAEPLVPGGYGAALLLDGWALLGRADLRAGEEAVRRWMAASALVRPAREGGQVVVVADSGIPAVQALVRWDPAGFAAAELAQRGEVGLPPAVHLAAVDGSPAAVADFLEAARLPDSVEQLGPVELPPGARLPFSAEGDEPEHAERMLLRAPRRGVGALARALLEAQAVRSARRDAPPVRVQVDPLRIG